MQRVTIFPDRDRYLLVVAAIDDDTGALFDQMGLQGGGYTWEGLAHALIALKAPDLAAQVEINAEGDEMYTYAATREPLERLEALLLAACSDHSLLRAAINEAGDDLE